MSYYFKFKKGENKRNVVYAQYTGKRNENNLCEVLCFPNGENVKCFRLYIPETTQRKARKLILELINK